MDVRTPIPTIGGDWLPRFSESWKAQAAQLKQQFGEAVEKILMPPEYPTDVPIVYVKKSALVELLAFMKKEPAFEYDFLADLTATDETVDPRFEIVYNLFSTTKKYRFRVKTRVRDGEDVPTVTGLWQGADWPEREIWDMYGVRFAGHPDLRRILMDERYKGHPLRKDFPLKGYQVVTEPELADPKLVDYDFASPGAPKGHDPDDLWEGARTIVNIGPNHPAMHGSFRMVAKLNGETIEKSYCEFGYTHRAKEKQGEYKTYHQYIVYTDRLNYVSALANNFTYAMAVEKLMGIQVPERTVWIRMIACEISRVIDHLVCIGINAVDLGAFTYFLYGYHQREEAYTLIEKLCGARLTTSYCRIGGLSADAPEGFEKELKAWVKKTREVVDEMDRLLTGNQIWHKRTRGISVFDREKCIQYGFTGPNARAAGVDVDLRRDQPCMFYKDVQFDVPLARDGDIFSRYIVRIEEVRQSLNILAQCADRLKPGPIWVEDKRVRIPDKEQVHNTMEGLIYHFKFFMTGFEVPEGEAYTQYEAPNGELGFYIVSKGATKAHRMRIRGPSLWHFQGLSPMVEGEKIADMVGALGSINVIAGELDR